MRMGCFGVVINNANYPIIPEKLELGARRRCREPTVVVDEYAVEPIDREEIFDHVRYIRDPELPNSLEALQIITQDSIEVDDARSYVRVTFTPTNPGCHMSKTMGVCLRVKLMQSLPSRYKIDIRVAPGSHHSEAEVNKQLNDKERIAAALEGSSELLSVIDKCLAPSYQS